MAQLLLEFNPSPVLAVVTPELIEEVMADICSGSQPLDLHKALATRVFGIQARSVTPYLRREAKRMAFLATYHPGVFTGRVSAASPAFSLPYLGSLAVMVPRHDEWKWGATVTGRLNRTEPQVQYLSKARNWPVQAMAAHLVEAADQLWLSLESGGISFLPDDKSQKASEHATRMNQGTLPIHQGVGSDYTYYKKPGRHLPTLLKGMIARLSPDHYPEKL